MRKIKTIISAVLITALAISSTGCNMITKTEAAKRMAVVAKVYEKNITNGEVDDRMAPVLAQSKSSGTDLTLPANKTQLTQAKTSVLDQIIQERIIYKKADELKVAADTKALNDEIEKQITSIKANFNNDEYKFKEALKTYGYTLDMLKNEIKFSLLQSKIADYIAKDVQITDAEIQKYYDDNKATKFTEQPDTLQIANALFTTEDAAKAALARIKAGEKFEKIADEVNTDATKGKGGDLGVYYYDDSRNQSEGKALVTEFFNAAVKLSEGQVSDPVKSTYGWHLIKVTNIKRYPVKALAAVKDEIKTTLLAQKKSDLYSTNYTKWKTEAKIETEKYKKNLEL